MISVLSHIFLDQSINKLGELAFQLKCIIQQRKINIPCLFLCMVEASNDQSSKKVQIVKFSSLIKAILISLLKNRIRYLMGISSFFSFICGQKYDFRAAKFFLQATIFVLCTDNFNCLRPFNFIYLRRNVPEPGIFNPLVTHLVLSFI